MRLGANWVYDGREPGLEEARDRFLRLKPDSVVISSHATEAEYQWLHETFPDLEYTIRAKTGPANQGSYPSDILDYDEWRQPDGSQVEHTLRDALNWLKARGKTLRVTMGTEPDLEMVKGDVNNPRTIDAAVAEYARWFDEESAKIKAEFPEALISVAPISQGNHARSLRWRLALVPQYMASDFFGIHNYIPMGQPPAEWGDQYMWYRDSFKKRPILNLETNDAGQYGSLNDVERAERYKAYIEQVAATGDVDEIDIFTVPGGASDDAERARGNEWWFITPEMADVIGQANRESAPPIIVDPIEPESVEVAPMTRDQARRRALVDVWNGESTKAPYNPESAIGAYWEAHYKDMGSACGPEWAADDGSVWQGFALGLWVATPGDPWTVEQAA